ncbi:hypothetical protein [Cohnella abietis]|uniref:hypothetical protein n=1 Tax=Cohnella abietis TaxID=2507935 RepID=UPI00102E4643|nr:hypothetical protein [Cohnella abietis]
MYDIFEQRGLDEVRLEGDVRYFRAMWSGGGTSGGRCTIFSSNGVWTRYVWREMYDIFEQRGLDEVRLEGDVRYFRATGSGGGTSGGRCTIFSSNLVWGRHVWREMFDIFEQRGLDEVRLKGDVRYFRATWSGRGTFGGRCTIFSSNGVWRRHVWREMYDIFDQHGLDATRLEGAVRYFRATEVLSGWVWK